MKIAVVMATYNGGRYLEHQIESIRAQSYQNWELVIRDDGSTDDTVRTLERYKSLDNRITIIPFSGPKLGYCQNFNLALQIASERNFDVYFLSDQDDVWHTNKIQSQLDQAFQNNPHPPTLCHSDLELIDAAGNRLKPSYAKHLGLEPKNHRHFKSLVMQNNVTGCTLCLNKSLLELALPIPECMENHDHWLALVASITGGISYCETPLTRYRQHSSNTIGARSFFQQSWTQKNIRKVYLRHKHKHAGKLQALKILSDRLKKTSSAKTFELDKYLEIANSDSSGLSKIQRLKAQGFRCQTANGYLINLLAS